MKRVAGNLQLLALISAMFSAHSPEALGMPFARGYPERVKPNNKVPLTDEESEMLAGLSGKAKKQYVKSLKEKYRK